MLQASIANAIKFYPVNADGSPSATNPRYRPYQVQRQNGVFKEYCYYQPVDLSGQMTFQFFWVGAGGVGTAALDVRFFAVGGGQIGTVSIAGRATTNFSQINQIEIPWASVMWTAGLPTGRFFIEVRSPANVRLYRSEPLVNWPRKPLKMVYRNTGDHARYGPYSGCFEQHLALPGRLVEPDIMEMEIRAVTSDMRRLQLLHELEHVAILETEPIPHYLAEAIQYALNHDEVEINSVKYKKVEATIERAHVANFDLYTMRVKLVEVEDRLRYLGRLTSQYLLTPPEMQPPTDITATSFTANWTADNADSYTVQISTSPTFASILQAFDTPNTSQAFTGLSACVKYYVRVRGVGCNGVSAWSVLEVQHQISLHFRGLDKVKVLSFSEKLTRLEAFNVFANLTNVRYKFAPLGTVPDWSLWPFRTLAQLQADITATAAANYSVRIEVDGYAQGSEGGLLLRFSSPTFYLQVGCLAYEFGGISQDVVLFLRDKSAINSLVATNSSQFVYQFIPSLAALLDTVPLFSSPNLAALNAAITAHFATGPVEKDYAVAVFALYVGASVSDLVGFNLQLQ